MSVSSMSTLWGGRAREQQLVGGELIGPCSAAEWAILPLLGFLHALPRYHSHAQGRSMQKNLQTKDFQADYLTKK